MYEKMKSVTKRNVNECIVNELMRWVKETNSSYAEKHHHDVSFHSVDDTRMLASPSTHASNSLDRGELRTRNGR